MFSNNGVTDSNIIDGYVWSQKNVFAVDEEDLVVSVDANFTHCTNEAPICTSLPK
jgi:hypothetical protein